MTVLHKLNNTQQLLNKNKKKPKTTDKRTRRYSDSILTDQATTVQLQNQIIDEEAEYI